MDIRRNIIFCVLICFNSFVFSQVSVFDNFENGNVEFINYDSVLNKLTVKPTLKTDSNTTRCWFNFGIANVDTTKELIIEYKYVRHFMAPEYPVYSYNQKDWYRLKAEKNINASSKKVVCKFAKDTVYFAAGYPYTYSDVLTFVDSIANNLYVDTTTLVVSEGGLRVPMIIIKDNIEEPTDLVWVIGRQHAFETTLNYTLEGMVDFFISDNEKAVEMRKKTAIYIVPMMDVDNVFRGASGRMQKPVDFNRDWTTEPHWKAVKKVQELICATSKMYNYRVFLDIHSAFPGTKKSIFGMFNNYNYIQREYFHVKDFLELFKKNTKYFLFEIIENNIGYYADFYNFGMIDSCIFASDFSSTIECDWNFNQNGNELNIKGLKKDGSFIAETLCDYLKFY